MVKKKSKQAKKHNKELKRKKKRLQLKRTDFTSAKVSSHERMLQDYYLVDKNGNEFLEIGKIMTLANMGKFKMSKRVLDYFIKSINHHSYKTIKREQDAEEAGKLVILNREYEMYLLFSAYSDMHSFNSRGMMINEHSEYAVSQLHKIKDEGLRFMFMTWHYQHESKSIDWKEYVSLAKELSVHDRLYLTYGLGSENTLKNVYSDIDYITNTIKKKFFRTDNYVELYRTFRVNRGENIREAVKRESLQHKHGTGNSYSNRKVSTFTTGRFINKYMVDKYTRKENKETGELYSLSDEQVSSKLEHLIMETARLIFDDDARFNDSFGVIGKFRVKQSNIITVSDTWDTQEFIVDTGKAEILDYRFLNIIDFITFDYLIQVVCKTQEQLGREGQKLFAQVRNLDILYDFLYWHIQKMCKTNKLLTRSYIENRDDSLDYIFDNICETIEKENKVNNATFNIVGSSNTNYYEIVVESDEKQFCSYAQNQDELDRIDLGIATDLRQTKKSWNQYTTSS